MLIGGRFSPLSPLAVVSELGLQAALKPDVIVLHNADVYMCQWRRTLAELLQLGKVRAPLPLLPPPQKNIIIPRLSLLAPAQSPLSPPLVPRLPLLAPDRPLLSDYNARQCAV